MIFNHHHLISVSMDNHLLIGDLNQRKKKKKSNYFKINVSHVICEISFITIYLLFSNLNLYRQRISFFLFCLFVCLRAFLSFLFRLIVFFSLSLFFFSVVIIDVVLYFFLARTSKFTHARTTSRLLVDFTRLVIICMCSYQHNYRLLSFLSLSLFFLCSLNSFFLCVLHEKLKFKKIEFIQ
jgi:hypothetical protein